MDDAERLRALAFASIPKKSYCWVRADREEGELSSDGEVELDKIKQPKSRKRPLKKRRGGFQSAAPPTGVPRQNFKTARSRFPLSLQFPETQLQPVPVKEKSWQKPEDMPHIITKTLQNTAQLQRTLPPFNSGAEHHKPNNINKNNNINNIADNQFLIKFSDSENDSESDGEPGGKDPDEVEKDKSTPKPANLSLEINRMKKQIAAMERVKSKPLPAPRTIKPTKNPASKPVIGKVNEKQNPVSELEPSKKQGSTGAQQAGDVHKRKRDEINEAEACKRAKRVSTLPASSPVNETMAIVSAAPPQPELVIGAPVEKLSPEVVKVSEPELGKSALELLEMEEEELDKEQEAAQNLRHSCEIRERLARKAYREAQEALRRANAECEHLHRKREMLSLRVKAAEIKHYSKASGDELLQSFLVEPAPQKPTAAPATADALERQKADAGNELVSLDPASASMHEAENDAAIENGSPRSGEQVIDDKTKDSTENANAERPDEEPQSSSSSAGDLRRTPATLPKEPAADPPPPPAPARAADALPGGDQLQLIKPPGSSAASSEVIEPKKIPVVTKTTVRRSTKPSSGRLVVFRQVSFTSEASTADAPYGHLQQEKPETSGPSSCVYESPLMKAGAPLDPFKPVCKYEHRGICNNEACGFQHMKRGAESGAFSQRSDWGSVCFSGPTYRIGRYLMRDSTPEMQLVRLGGSLKAGNEGSYSFLTSVAVQRPLPRDMPCIFHSLRGEREIAEAFEGESVSKQNHAELLSLDSSVDSCLELALSILQFDINLKNTNCLKNALYVLSRALEANQSSIALWVVYLLLFSVRDTLSKKDDMFLHAIRQNRYSYELWILVLSSRSSLAAILESYELAILTLCEDANKSSERSSCILDIVLRMLYTMIISESKATSWIEELLLAPTSSRRWKSSSIVLKNLSPSDASILWITCAYISAHGQMPSSVICRLGCKQVPRMPQMEIEWGEGEPRREELRSKVVSVMEAGARWLSSTQDAQAQEFLVVNYMRFLLASGDFARASTLGIQAVQLHPFSAELVVLLANVQKLVSGTKSGLGVFQSSLSKWPSEKPGAQELWSQYAGHALSWEGEESALLILRRYSSSPDGGLSNQVAGDSSFYLLNQALLEALSGNTREAQQALEKALSSSEGDDIHCWLEYSSFRLQGMSFESESFQRALLEILDRCHIQSRFSSSLSPLGRGFLRGIRKRRIRAFVDNLLGAAPSDHFFINSVLRSTFGPELLPGDVAEFKLLVDFVGGILELFPGNHAVAMAFSRAVRHRMRSSRALPASTPAFAASLLVYSLRCSLPPASESCWLEAGELLQDLGLGEACESFYRNSLSIYPFSAALWRRYAARNEAISAAREAGLAI